MKALFCLLLFTISSFPLFAQTAQSAYITYAKVDSELTAYYHIIMSNNDSNFHASRVKADISCKGSTPISLLGLTQIEKRAIQTNCNFTEKSYQYVFAKEIDLNDTAYLALKNCCELELGLSLNFRDTSINTLQKKQTTLYVYTQFNTCGSTANKESAQLSSTFSNLRPSLNQPFYANLGAFDTADFDSLSLELTSPIESKTDTTKFVSGLHSKLPFSPYYPGTLAYPYKNPNASPPIGFFLDSEQGDIIYTPTKLDIGPLVIKIKEWRTINGNATKVGEMVIETFISTISSTENNAPTLNGPYSSQICEGETLCFDIKTNDITFVPPPPNPSPAPDTVKISWNRGIPQANFTVINPTERLQIGRFCWTPTADDVSNLPYRFTVTGRDNHCPTNAVTTRSYFVLVHAKPKLRVNIEQIMDGYSITTSVLNSSAGAYIYSHKLLDTNLNLETDTGIGYFNSTKSALSTTRDDTLSLKKSGTYYIETIVTQGSCTSLVLDTIQFLTSTIKDVNTITLTFFPNPTRTEIQWETKLDEAIIYNALGEEIHRVYAKEKTPVIGWKTGLYFIEAYQDNTLFIGKFVVN